MTCFKKWKYSLLYW